MKRDAIDLDHVNVFRLFSKYFVPTLLGMLSMSAVTAIDGIFVGHGVGSDGIAAINICIPLLMLFTGVGLMIGAGCSVVASIQMSRGKEKTARMNVTQGSVVRDVDHAGPVAVHSVVSRQNMSFARLFGTSAAIGERLSVLVHTFATVSNLGVHFAVHHSAGRRTPTGNVVQYHSGSRQYRTGLAVRLPVELGRNGRSGSHNDQPGHRRHHQPGISTVPCTASASGHAQMEPEESASVAAQHRLPVSHRFIGTAGESTMAVLMFTGNQVFMHYLGDDGVGAFGIICYYMPFVFMVGNAIAQSAQPIISYNFGAGLHERVVKTERIALATAVTCGMFVTLLFVFCPQYLVGLFIDPTVPAARIAIAGFPPFSAAFVFFILNLTAVGYFQSVERIRPATIFALLRGFFFLVPSFFFLPKILHIDGIWLALALSEISTTICIILFYLYCRRNDRKTE